MGGEASYVWKGALHNPWSLGLQLRLTIVPTFKCVGTGLIEGRNSKIVLLFLLLDARLNFLEVYHIVFRKLSKFVKNF